MKLYLTIVCLIYVSTIFSQNLVPNPSFEETNKLPNIWTRSEKEFDNALNAWTTPNQTIPDIISTLVDEKFWANPNNKKQSAGKQMPRTGNTMVGFRTYGEGDDGAVACWHEYIQAKLTQPLKAGTEYYVEFWVADAERGIRSSNNIGALFTDEPISTGNRLPIYKTPHINYCKVIENIEWMKISGFYTPDSNKTYITIGNFYPDVQTQIIEQKTGSVQGGYYYIDDILVRAKEGADVATGCKPEKVIIPPEKQPVEEDKPDITTSQQELTQINYQIGETVKLDNIFFETDKSVLLPESITELDKLVKLMTDNNTLKIEINGHTDNVGTDEYNLKLSKARAKAVVDYLISKGIADTRLSSNGYGSEKPIATNYTEEGRSQNRRVEFKVVGK